MKIIFSEIKNSDIFEDDFAHLSARRGTIEFKKMSAAGGIAVVYAPNGTGKTSLANLLSAEVSKENCVFYATNECGGTISPETNSFHIVRDQIDRNVIKGETTDYLIGAQIRREYELKDRIDSMFMEAYKALSVKYKREFMVSKVGDCLLVCLESLQGGTYRKAIEYIRSIVNAKQHGQNIDKAEFIEFIRNGKNKPCDFEMNEEQKRFVVSDLSQAKIVRKILEINPESIVPNADIVLLEQNDDAIAVLNKYHSYDNCIVCDNILFNGDDLLSKKTKNRQNIYNRLDDETKSILDQIVLNSSISVFDPFSIKETVSSFISNGNPVDLLKLQQKLKRCIVEIGYEMFDDLFHCFDNTSLFEDFSEYSQLIATKPQLDSEELLFIEDVVSENIGKNIRVVRDDENGGVYRLKIGDKDLLGVDRSEMELSTGEQNFISLAFELLLARRSNKKYVVIDDPISSLDSVYKNKIAFCIIKFLENKNQIVLTHNTDLVRLLDVQHHSCFNLYILNNVHDGENGFIPVSEYEKKLLINLHCLVAFFQDKGEVRLAKVINNRRQFLMSMIPFIRGYSHICLDPYDYYGKLSGIMHGYNTRSLDIIPIYNKLFGAVFSGSETIGPDDILELDCSGLDIIDKGHLPLLADTLEQTLVYYYLRMKVERELAEIFDLKVKDGMMLSQIIQKAFRCSEADPCYEKMREFRIFFVSRKTLLNEFNHFEGNMNIFQPAIDITKSALQKEVLEINNKLAEVRRFRQTQLLPVIKKDDDSFNFHS